MLCAVPALRALRAGFPDARIVLVGLPWAKEFVSRYRAYLDDFREFPGYPGLPEQEPRIERVPAFLAAMQAEAFDLAIQMHGSGVITNPLTQLFGAARSAGFYQPGSDVPSPWFLPYPARGLEVRRLLLLLEHLGIPPQGEALEFPINQDDHEAASRLAATHGIERGRYVVIHPGASVSERCWSPDRFARAAEAMASQGFAIVVTGTSGEAELTATVAGLLRGTAIDLAGRTGLGALAALLAGARLLICNDTGVSHVADALGVPSVVISTGTNPERWAPADRRLHRVLCDDRGVRVEQVIDQAVELLGATAGCAALAASRGLREVVMV
jgi:ADP-heptose:LPS heptosyltransferase